MTKKEHIARHKLLHRYLDEIVADYISCSPYELGKHLTNTNVMELLEWSHKQTLNPDKPRL